MMPVFRFFSKPKRGHFLDADEVLADSSSSLAFGHEGKLERPIEALAYRIFLVFIGIGLLYLGSFAFRLQIKSGNVFFAQAQENRFLVRPVYPPRGIIYDEFGKSLVENIPSFGIVLSKEDFIKSGGNLTELMATLATVLHEPEAYFYDAGIPENNDPHSLEARTVLAEEISPDDMVSIAPKISSLPGIQIFEGYRRVYQDPYAFSHIFGFVGKLSDADIRANPDLSSEETIGKSGLESYYDSLLRGRGGKKIVEVNAAGHETQFKFVEAPENGTGLKLGIDGDLQKIAYNTIKHYVEGAEKGASAVFLDPRDGTIRALVSYPGFDSNRFGNALSQKEFSRVVSDPLHPLFNRAIGGEFPSGSTIKPMMAAAALQENIIDPEKKIYDEGFIEIPNPYKPGESSKFVDWRKQGWVNMYDAIAISANVYFYIVGGGFHGQPGLGIDRINKYMHLFGLGSLLGIDLPGEKPGVVPNPEWKKTADPGNPIWRIGDTYNVSIGQGGVKVTPLQMATLTAAIANGGTLYQPRLAVSPMDGSAFTSKILRDHIVNPDVLEKVKKGMRQTVTAGTAKLLQQVPVAVAAKTGTAQAGSGLPHAWVTAFAPFDHPELVGVVMVEHAGEGATIAVPITNDIMKWYFGGRYALKVNTATTTPNN